MKKGIMAFEKIVALVIVIIIIILVVFLIMKIDVLKEAFLNLVDRVFGLHLT